MQARFAIVDAAYCLNLYWLCIVAPAIIIAMIRAPLLMLLVCSIWAGFCTWISSLVRVENSHAWGLSGYTAPIIVITIQAEPLLMPQFAGRALQRYFVLGIICAIVADLRFVAIDQETFIMNSTVSSSIGYRLMQLCIKHGDSDEMDKAWLAGCCGVRQRWKGCAAT
ncbi:FUSC family protein [Shigella flexneri]